MSGEILLLYLIVMMMTKLGVNNPKLHKKTILLNGGNAGWQKQEKQV